MTSEATKPESGVLGAAAFVHERLGHAAAHRESLPEARGEVGAREREKFLVAVEASAVFGREHAADGGGLDGAEQEARERKRQEFIPVRPLQQRQVKAGDFMGDIAEELHAARFEVKQGCGGDSADDHEQRDGLVLEEYFSEHEHRERGEAGDQRRGVRVAEMPEEMAHVFPEIPVRAREAEELGQLRAREQKGDPAFETDEHRFGDEIDDGAAPDEPGDERDRGHEHRRRGRERRQSAKDRRRPGRRARSRPAARWPT